MGEVGALRGIAGAAFHKYFEEPERHFVMPLTSLAGGADRLEHSEMTGCRSHHFFNMLSERDTRIMLEPQAEQALDEWLRHLPALFVPDFPANVLAARPRQVSSWQFPDRLRPDSRRQCGSALTGNDM